MSSFAPLALALAAALAVATPAHARGAPAPEPSPEMIAAGFMEAHPDLLWRTRAVAFYEEQEFDEAFERFRRAARFADKPSQAMVGEMYWHGRGVAQDKALGYAWMDLAAERQWRPFVIRRELYWNDLSAEQREEALKVGAELYAEFGDDVAKARKETVLRRERNEITGSRTGFVGNLTIEIPSAGGGSTVIRGDELFDPQYWDVERYWAWQESVWKEARPGLVEVGPVSTPAPPPADDKDEGGQP